MIQIFPCGDPAVKGFLSITKKGAAVATGRPRGFDTDAALDRAMEVFWRKGYEGASLADLTGAMGINPPSLYAAFGNKEGLFRKALDRYLEGPSAYQRAALEAPTARAAVEALFEGACAMAACPDQPGGCLVVQAALACSDAASAVRQDLIARRAAGEAAIRERLLRARDEGDLPPDADPATLARFVVAVIYGMSVLAAGGAGQDELRGVAAAALRGWPAAGAPLQSPRG